MNDGCDFLASGSAPVRFRFIRPPPPQPDPSAAPAPLICPLLLVTTAAAPLALLMSANNRRPLPPLGSRRNASNPLKKFHDLLKFRNKIQ